MEYILEEIWVNEIIYKLDIIKIFRLCQVNKKFNNLDDNIWKLLYNKHFLNTKMDNIANSYKFIFKLCVILNNLEHKIMFGTNNIGDTFKIQELCLDGKLSDKIPIELCHLTNLTDLSMNLCKISLIRDELFNLTELKYLYMVNNQIKMIPSNIAKLKHIKYLYLTKNQITIIPDEIGELINLEGVDISNNLIEIIPVAISKLKKLKYISLSNNKINMIPPELGELSILKGINLNNNFIETIPFELTKLTMLSSLNLSENDLPNIYQFNKQKFNFNDRHQVLQLFKVLQSPAIQIIHKFDKHYHT